MHKIYFTFIFLLQVIIGISQIAPCPSHIQKLSQINNVTIPRFEKVVIPIVIHLIEQEGALEIEEIDVFNALELLNSKFGSQVESLQDLPTYSTPGIVGFEFKLAELDPAGSETSGIIKRKTSFANIGDLISENGISYIKNDDLGGSDPWDTERYVNIWIGERSLSLGSTISFTTENADLEGIIISFNGLKESPKTIIHEMGHYFGLLHPWGNFTGCDDEDDGIEDTPFQAFPDFDCSSKLACGNFTLPGNIMDFNADDCLLYFTNIQALRMQQFAVAYKSQLINSTDCFRQHLPLGDDLINTNNFLGYLEVYMDSANPLDEARLLSIDGKTIASASANGQSFLNIPIIGIPPGIYVLVLIRGKELMSKKIIIKR